MTLVVIASTSAASTKALSASLGSVGLGLSFVDFQGTSSEITSVQSSDGFVGFNGIGHFYKSEAPGATGLAIGYDADLLDRAMRFENASQF